MSNQVNGSSPNTPPLLPDFEIELNSEEISWLCLVKEAAKSGSSESQKNLEVLANKITSTNPSVKEVIQAVQKVIATNFKDLSDLYSKANNTLLSFKMGSPPSETRRPKTPGFLN